MLPETSQTKIHAMLKSLFIFFITAFANQPLLASIQESQGDLPINLTEHWIGLTCIVIFIFAYIFVMLEEYTHLRKSKPVILAAGIIWVLIAWFYQTQHHLPQDLIGEAIRHNLLEYAELMLFLLVAMTYINAMQERQIFNALRAWLVQKGFNLRQLFWITGILAFFISPIADNLTTALVMCAVILAVGANNSPFILIACINIVVAANAGGAFSPFGDITTLLVWQKNISTAQGLVDFWSFFHLFIPSLVNWLIPAFIMSLWVSKQQPSSTQAHHPMKQGAIPIIFLFILTIMTAITFHNYLHIPPVIGMLTGLSYLQFFGYYLKITENKQLASSANDKFEAFNVFRHIERAEWDTLLFFYGVIMCVGGLGFLGYLSLASEFMYQDLGTTQANILVGILSAIIDNIPVMFTVLNMMPDMSMGQWLLVTLTAGVGGSLLSIGSAAGVALMGQAKGQYTFVGHLKWMPVIALGYAASIATHLWLNADLL